MHVWLHNALTGLTEIVFLSGALYCVHKAEKRRIYPAFWQLLMFAAISDAVLVLDMVALGSHLLNPVHAYSVYFYTYWLSFGIQSVLMLRVLHEMFRHAVRSVPGVQKLGRPIFFWALAVSVILAVASGMTTHASTMSLLLAGAQVMMRSQSILALCMLAFLAFASNTLGVSFRSRIFGVIFGFGMIATAQLVYASLSFVHIGALVNVANMVQEGVYLGAIALWAGYFIQPEPARKLVAMPVTSPLMRWNEVAQSLGNPAGQVAVSYPPSFMNDVFDLVENVMGPANWPTEVPAISSRPGPIAS